MSRLPASPCRSQALIQLEPILLATFNDRTRDVDAEVRDTMHYALFSASDRFCASSAWLIGPRVGVPPMKLSAAICAIETVRCALDFKLRSRFGRPEHFVEPMVAEAATFGLLPVAFDMVLSAENALSESERCAVAKTLAHASSPMRAVLALQLEARLSSEGRVHSLSREEIYKLQQSKVNPSFSASGLALSALSARRDLAQLESWFSRLGLFAVCVEELQGTSGSTLALSKTMPHPEAMDLVKSLEADLLERARELGIRDAAHEIIEPLADLLKTRLQ